jgi:hypothetical protein
MRRTRTTRSKSKSEIIEKAKEPYPGYFAPDMVKWREDIARIQAKAREGFEFGFANFVIEQGQGAVCPNGKTWLEQGRKLYGVDRFNFAMRSEINRRRLNRAPGSPTSAEISSSC